MSMSLLSKKKAVKEFTEIKNVNNQCVLGVDALLDRSDLTAEEIEFLTTLKTHLCNMNVVFDRMSKML